MQKSVTFIMLCLLLLYNYTSAIVKNQTYDCCENFTGDVKYVIYGVGGGVRISYTLIIIKILKIIDCSRCIT